MLRKPIILRRNPSAFQSLREGDVLVGRVGEKIAEGRYRIQFQGGDFIAGFDGFLKRGSLITTVVQKNFPELTLRLYSRKDREKHWQNQIRNYESVHSQEIVVFTPLLRHILVALENDLNVVSFSEPVEELQTFLEELQLPMKKEKKQLEQHLRYRRQVNLETILDCYFRFEMFLLSQNQKDSYVSSLLMWLERLYFYLFLEKQQWQQGAACFSMQLCFQTRPMNSLILLIDGNFSFEEAFILSLDLKEKRPLQFSKEKKIWGFTEDSFEKNIFAPQKNVRLFDFSKLFQWNCLV